MNRKQRMMDAYRKIAQKAVDANKEYRLHFLFSASVVALKRAHAKVNYETYFKYFQEEYMKTLDEPDKEMKEANEIVGEDIVFQWKREWEE